MPLLFSTIIPNGTDLVLPVLYLSLKALHLIAMVSWFAGLFYLPRLFVYHCQALQAADSAGNARFQIMERKLLNIITTPAGLITLVTGLAMLFMHPYLLEGWWMDAVLLLSASLVGFHGYCALCVRRFSTDQNRHGERFYRRFNEWPTLVLVTTVLLFTFRPGT